MLLLLGMLLLLLLLLLLLAWHLQWTPHPLACLPLCPLPFRSWIL